MDLTHHISVPASLEDTWAVFARPSQLAHCFPGATLSRADGDDFTGSIKVKLGPLALVYEGAGRYVKRDEQRRRLEIEFHGEDQRGHGAAEGTVTARFAADGDKTGIELDTELRLTGKPEQFGPAVLSDVNHRLLDQFASCIAGRFADGSILEPEPALDTQHDVRHGAGPAPQQGLASSNEPQSPTAANIEIAETPVDVDAGPALGPREVPAGVSSSSRSSPGGSRPSPAPRRAMVDRPVSWVPASNSSETDFEMFARVLPPLLKRYWPFLGGAGLAALVASKITGRTKKKRR